MDDRKADARDGAMIAEQDVAEADQEERVGRRDVLAKGVALAAGAAAMAIGYGSAPDTATAYDGQLLMCGFGMFADSTTILRNYNGGMVSLSCNDPTTTCGILAVHGPNRANGWNAAVLGNSYREGAGVLGQAKTTGPGVKGTSKEGHGVVGYVSTGSAGVCGENPSAGPGMQGTSNNGPGVRAESAGWHAIYSTVTNGQSAVYSENAANGSSQGGTGVYGRSTNGAGVSGIATHGPGVKGRSTRQHGVYGTVANARSGVYGENLGSGPGVAGVSVGGAGVKGTSTNSHGLYGLVRNTKAAVYGENKSTGSGVAGRSPAGVGVAGNSTTGVGVRAESEAGWALDVTGPVKFKQSDRVLIRKGATEYIVSDVTLSTTPVIIVSPNGELGAGVFVKYAGPTTIPKQFKIVLNKPAAGDVLCTWFVLR